MPPNPLWNCKHATTILFTSMMSSTLFILSMTFERFYGIILPHKAASFNTVKKAKMTISSCVIFSILFNLPNLFYSTNNRVSCSYNTSLPLFNVYYWLTFVFTFLIPFIFLLLMNGIIIHTLRKRSHTNILKFGNQCQGHNEGQTLKMKSTERQIYITLLLVTFGFLVLTTPSKITPLYVQGLGYGDTPRMFAVSYMFYHLSHKALHTNNGINFLFYVISGHKFRNDLIKLLCCCKKYNQTPIMSSDNNSSCSSQREMNENVTSVSASVLGRKGIKIDLPGA